MKRFSICVLTVLVLVGCEKGKDSISVQYEAKIVGFDLNCSTCLVSFSDDLPQVKSMAGDSPDNYYEIVNLNKSNFRVGQKLVMQVRKVQESEFPVCISQYASTNYKKLVAFNFRNYSELKLNDTIELTYKNCLDDTNKQNYICFDSLVSDSRCPTGAQCVWAGEAVVRFKVEKYNSEPVYIYLKEGDKDAVIGGYHISFIKLLPYPEMGNSPKLEDYKAMIVIKNS